MKTRRSIFIFLITLVLVSIPTSALSASGVAAVDIKSHDASSFPEVQLLLRVTDVNGLPVSDLQEDEITVQEDSNRISNYTLAPVQTGSYVSIVIDAGSGINANGATFQSRLVEIKQVINNYVQRMGANDHVEILLLRPRDQITVLQEFTNEKSRIGGVIDSLVLEDANSLSYGLEGVSRALDNLSSVGDKSGYRAVLLLSTSIQDQGRRYLTMQELTAKANGLAIPVHTLLFRHSDLTPHQLDKLAEDTAGQYAYYSRAQVDFPILDFILNQGLEYALTYRSTNPVATRIVTVTVLPGLNGPVFDDLRLTLNPVPGPAEVTSVTINNGDPIIRQPDDRAGEYTYWPTEVPVEFFVRWPDGYGTRAFEWAELVVDGNVVGGRLTDLPVGDRIATTWDLRPFAEAGEASHTIQVRFVDALGFEVVSPVHTTPLTIRAGLCGQYQGTAQILCTFRSVVAPALGVLSFLVVVALVAYYYLRPDDFRARLGGVQAKVQKFADEVTQTLRIRGRGGESGGQLPMAYLHVVKGTLGMRPRYPLYQRVTQIGRDDPSLKVEDGDIAITDKAVSRPHLSIAILGDEFTVTDMGSANGSWLNGIELEAEEEQALSEGDLIELAEYEPGERLVVFSFSMYGETPDAQLSSNEELLEDDITTPTRRKKGGDSTR